MIKEIYFNIFHPKKGIILCLLIAFFGLNNITTSLGQICSVVTESDNADDASQDLSAHLLMFLSKKIT